MTRYTHPHMTFEVRADKTPVTTTVEPSSLHIPMFLIHAQTGKEFEPYLASYAELLDLLGEDTFNERGPYFQHPTRFLLEACTRQRVMVARMVPEDAAVATLVIEAQLDFTKVTQYQKSGDGSRLEDEEGNYIPLRDSNNQIITEDGVTLTWIVRELAEDETYDTLVPRDIALPGGGVRRILPWVASTARYRGKYINTTGFRLYAPSVPDTDAETAIGARLYNFEPVRLLASDGISTPIYDLFEKKTNSVSFAKDAYDPGVAAAVDFRRVLQRMYVNTDDQTERAQLLPYDIKFYFDSADELAQCVLSVSPELDEADAPFLNLLTGINYDQVPYDHFVVTNAAEVMNANVVLYHRGGSDGTLGRASLEAMTRAYMTGDLFPEIRDYARHPVTHIYDSGYTLETKLALLRIWKIRRDVKIEFSTQDVSRRPNTMDEDYSTALALDAQIRLYPESLLFGTEAMRAQITAQAWYLTTDPSQETLVPFLFDRLIKRCATDSTYRVMGTIKGRPNSEVKVFSSANWAPVSDSQKKLFWSTRVNMAVYYDRKGLFYPDYRSVYVDEKSPLSSDLVVDHIVYMGRLAFRQWTIHVGREEPFETISADVKRDLEADLATAFGSKYDLTVTVYKTATNTAEGFSQTVQIAMKAPMASRVWNFVIPVGRKD